MKTYFISDLHLGAPYFPDSREAECRVVKFLNSIKRDADEIFLLGDILDYWYEYKYVVPKGFVRFFGKLAELADIGVKITWLIGNHDIWLFDYLPSEIGITVVDGPIVTNIKGHRFLLSHGDGLGKTPVKFKFLRTLFRNKFCQWLYAGIHPRWTIPFAQGWSRHSRSEGMKKPQEADGEMVENLKRYAQGVADANPRIEYFVFGHLHIPVDDTLEGGARFMVLGDWISHFTFATFDKNSGLILHTASL